MALFAIGDLHLSLGTNKPMDIFQGWDNYVQLLEERWRATVSDLDTVVVVGDISWAMDLSQTVRDFSFLQALPGKKILLKGNHDYWFSTKTKVEQFIGANGFDSLQILFNNSYPYEEFVLCGTRGWMNEIGEDVDKKVLNREAGRLRLSLEHGKKTGKDPIVFLHYPPIYRGNECEEMLAVFEEHAVYRCYYGHLHGGAISHATQGLHRGIDFKLVSSDAVRFCPVRVDTSSESMFR